MSGVVPRLVLLALAAVAPSDAFLTGIQCSTCRTLGPLAIGLMRLTHSTEILRGQTRSACRLLPVHTAVCHGFVDSWVDAFSFILQKSQLSAAQMCSIFLKSCPAEGGLDLDVTLDLPETPGAGKAKRRDHRYPRPTTAGLKVLHIADIHLDVHYHEGADNACPEELCCRAENGFPVKKTRRAGAWGDYNKCDSPPKLLHSMVEHIARRHKSDLEYIMWTGDNAPHDSWKTSRRDVLNATEHVTSLLRHHFPGVTVFPVVGNHDSAPTNYFPPLEVEKHNFSMSGMYHDFAKLWRPWLPPAALKTLRRSGFYSVRVRPGFRIIVLNTNVAYRYNMWVLLTARTDPHHQLKWLAGVLRSARSSGERCHVIGHVSPADPDILPAWSHLYHEIIRSYQDVVTAQFFSHTHLNEIQVYKDHKDRPFSVSYVSPSLTPWKNVNPGYRIYTIDGARGNHSSWEVVDYERWTADLADANREPVEGPRWRRQASAARRYRLQNLSPRRWSRMVNKMLLTGKMFNRYHRDQSGAARVRGPCDIACRLRTVCGMVTTDRTSTLHCDIVRLLHRMGTAVGLS